MRQLSILQAVSADLGFPREITAVPAGHDCPTHDVPLLEHQLETISGWHALTACPAYDGTCSYDPDTDPEQIDPPEDDESNPDAKPGKHAPTGPSNSGGF